MRLCSGQAFANRAQDAGDQGRAGIRSQPFREWQRVLAAEEDKNTKRKEDPTWAKGSLVSSHRLTRLRGVSLVGQRCVCLCFGEWRTLVFFTPFTFAI